MSRLLIWPADALPGVLQGWPWGWHPNSFHSQTPRGFMPGTGDNIPSQAGVCPRDGGLGGGGHGLPAEPHFCPPASPQPGRGWLPLVPAALSLPFCTEDEQEREAAFWVKFFGFWLF